MTRFLSLAAMPTFAAMALLTAAFDGSAAAHCLPATSAVPLNGMVVMYFLMSAFHMAPWVRKVVPEAA